MGTVIEQVELYYREPRENADKIYKIELTREDAGGYRVIGYNGRRGARLTPQPKTEYPVSYNTARRLFDELEQSKLNHRRTPYKVRDRYTAGREAGAGTGMPREKAARTETRPPAASRSPVAARDAGDLPDAEPPAPLTGAHPDDGTYTATYVEALEL